MSVHPQNGGNWRPCPQACLMSSSTCPQGPDLSAVMGNHSSMALNQTDLEVPFGQYLTSSTCLLPNGKMEAQQGQGETSDPLTGMHMAESCLVLYLTSLRSLQFSLMPQAAGYQVHSTKKGAVTGLTFLFGVPRWSEP